MEYLELSMHEITHLFLTFLAAGSTWFFCSRTQALKYKKILLTFLGAFLGEFFLDTDHLFDYVLAYGTHFRLDYFLQGRMFDKLHKTYVPLHGWEWIIILGIVICFVKNISLRIFLTALTLGVLFHMIYDMFYNHYSFLGYSLIYRIIHNFDVNYVTIIFQHIHLV